VGCHLAYKLVTLVLNLLGLGNDGVPSNDCNTLDSGLSKRGVMFKHNTCDNWLRTYNMLECYMTQFMNANVQVM